MTHIVKARGINDAFIEGLSLLKVIGEQEDSRNGPVLVAPGPVITEYSAPHERVLFNAKRDANPVFHLMEAIWMLGGFQRVDYLTPFNARMKEYADDGLIHGAYGARWATQLRTVIAELKKPGNRRAVLQLWDKNLDLAAPKKDVPCNTHVYFDLRHGALNMTVCCRSNDAIWGAYGANVVHFSMLQEFVAGAVNAGMGVYRQMSNNFHVYMRPEMMALVDNPDDDWHGVYPTTIPLMMEVEDENVLLLECYDFFKKPHLEPTNYFLRTVAFPLRRAYLMRKEGQAGWRPYVENTVPECDWKRAFLEWADRRETKE